MDPLGSMNRIASNDMDKIQ